MNSPLHLELEEQVIDQLSDNFSALRSCSLTCRRWLPRSRYHLFSAIRIRTKDELSQLLDTESFAKADKIQLVEVIMEKFDAPRSLKVQAELSGQTNKYVVDA